MSRILQTVTVDGETKLTSRPSDRGQLCPVCGQYLVGRKCPTGHGGPFAFVSIPPPYREGHDTRSPAPGEPAPPRTTPIPAAPSPATGVGGGGANACPTVPNRLDCGPDPDVTIREVVSRVCAVWGSIIEAAEAERVSNPGDQGLTDLAHVIDLAAGALDGVLDEIDHVYPPTTDDEPF